MSINICFILVISFLKVVSLSNNIFFISLIFSCLDLPSDNSKFSVFRANRVYFLTHANNASISLDIIVNMLILIFLERGLKELLSNFRREFSKLLKLYLIID
jgi:hypothetical protein